ncbi:MAG: hypothetical protein EAZ18_25850 [Oscillatoriales cyanobacterium]|nr:MAG: hypothetical protein EAZ18_25850 [Oscillatoriales cyanobacterium]
MEECPTVQGVKIISNIRTEIGQRGHWPKRALGIGQRGHWALAKEGIGQRGHWALGIKLTTVNSQQSNQILGRARSPSHKKKDFCGMGF